MKSKIVMLLMAVCISMGSLFAQGGERLNREEMEKKHMEMLKEKLNLTEDQHKKIKDIHAKYTPERNRQGERLSQEEREKRRTEFEKNRADRDKEVKEVLTPEQAVKYDELQKEMRENNRNRGDRNRD